MMPEEKLRRADIFASAVLVLLAAAVIAGALQMPMSGTYGGRPIHWYTSPGFFPLVLGMLLAACSAGVFVRACRRGGHRGIFGRSGQFIMNLPGNKVAHRILGIWAILFLYVLCLALHPFGGFGGTLEDLGLGRSTLTFFLLEPEGANYVISSFLFLATFILVFHSSSLPRPARVLLVAGLSLLVCWGVGYVFTAHLYTPLPW